MVDYSYEWDEAERAANFAKHGLDFRAVHFFGLSSSIVVPDVRADYGELRFRAFGYLRANARERKRHEL